MINRQKEDRSKNIGRKTSEFRYTENMYREKRQKEMIRTLDRKEA